ncbi:PTS transporter subunit IIC [Aggregatibacter actinomycetemcomitans]|uniref:PTS transporter subunit IIC n=1 Tax=Aggregatibacter actinomycetemcomitans TaxID=714 RepID=UPI0021CCCB49|nr:PTS transporter subunit IIC [Aggregatibacter actinomycetemcomitans]
MFTQIMQYILDLGPSVMLPIVIIILSLLLGMKAGDSFKAGKSVLALWGSGWLSA